MHSQSAQCYGSSIRNYFSDIDKSDSVKKEKFMNYEWIRLSSFKEFSASSKVSSIRLAQSGFYYSGKGLQAICFCCGLRNDSWNTTESVNEIHRRLSPHCNFVKGEQTNNVAIHADSKPQPPGESISNYSNQPAQGADGGPEDINSENIRHCRIQSKKPPESTQPFPISEDAVSSPINVLTNGSHQDPVSQIEQNRSRSRDKHTAENREFVCRFPGILNEHPKHPEYAIKSVRLNSYAGWPSTKPVQPEELSTAGFYYAGINDCVRCFFCGGGMKNWEYGDSPWIEHARWFPNCAYVKQCQGNAFVEMCRSANAEISTLNGAQGLILQHGKMVEDSFIEDLNSSAAIFVFDLGYSQTQVEDAIKQARLKQGKSELKGQHLLEFLLDNNCTTPVCSQSTSREALGNNHTPSVSCLDMGTENKTPQYRQDASVPKLNTSKPSHEQRALYEENKQLKEQMMCKICMDKDANIVFLPCGHMVSCVECAHALRKCAICRKIIQGTVRTYQS